jgi:hypothetical protein
MACPTCSPTRRTISNAQKVPLRKAATARGRTLVFSSDGRHGSQQSVSPVTQPHQKLTFPCASHGNAAACLLTSDCHFQHSVALAELFGTLEVDNLIILLPGRPLSIRRRPRTVFFSGTRVVSAMIGLARKHSFSGVLWRGITRHRSLC